MLNYNEQREELIKSYIGENWQKIYGKRGNNAAFLFPIIYSFYRKLDYFGVINIFIRIFLIVLSRLNYQYVSFLSIFVVGGINTYLFNRLYVSDVSKKVDDIVLRNSNLSYGELKNICASKGGVRSYLKIFMIAKSIILILLFLLGIVLGIGK